MSELLKIFITSGLTILGGIVIFIVGQIFTKFIVEPFYEHSKLIGEIANSLIYYGNVYAESKLSEEAKIVLRQQASQLMGRTNAIPFYGLWVIISFGRLPSRKYIIEASQELIGLSNETSKSSDSDRTRKIAKFLRIEILSERFGTIK